MSNDNGVKNLKQTSTIQDEETGLYNILSKRSKILMVKSHWLN